jgi:hypothetical protein
VPGEDGPGLSDDPLTTAGELGRETQPPLLESDVSRKRRGWLAPARTVAAVILAAGSLVFAFHQTPSVGGEQGPTPVPEPVPVRVVALGEPVGLIVRDGDLVEASGPVEEGSTMCSPAPVPAINVPCPHGIRVPGIEPTGGATLRGRWHPDGLSGIQRLPYSPTSAGMLGDSDLPGTPPCPAPAGGWRDGEDWSDDQVRDYLHAHAGQFAEPFATHIGNARILVVEVVSGDVDQARAALTAIYTDNLCVVAVPGGHSIAAEDNLQATIGKAVAALMDEDLGIYLASSEGGKMRVMMVQLTQPLYDKFAAIGLEHLILDPWIRPAGP